MADEFVSRDCDGGVLPTPVDWGAGLDSDLLDSLTAEQPPTRICVDDLVFDFPVPIPITPFGCVVPQVSVNLTSSWGGTPSANANVTSKVGDPCVWDMSFQMGIPCTTTDVSVGFSLVYASDYSYPSLPSISKTVSSVAGRCNSTIDLRLFFPTWVQGVEIMNTADPSVGIYSATIAPNGILTLFRGSGTGGGGQELMDGTLFAVKVSKVGGFSGNASSDCAYVYDVYPANVSWTSAVSPASSLRLMQSAEPETEVIPTTEYEWVPMGDVPWGWGTAFRLSVGSPASYEYHLYHVADERPLVAPCDCAT